MSALTLMELLGYVAAALTTTSFVPQVIQTFRTRSTEGISLGMYSILTTGIALWVVYGVAIGSAPMIVANAITLVLAAAILTLAVRLRGASRRPSDPADPPLVATQEPVVRRGAATTERRAAPNWARGGYGQQAAS